MVNVDETQKLSQFALQWWQQEILNNLHLLLKQMDAWADNTVAEEFQLRNVECAFCGIDDNAEVLQMGGEGKYVLLMFFCSSAGE